ncbi:unnamed protein product [Schistocephalus solidus]|uniref:RNase_Zc3h12a domain-containing protein n=1 Tax=Schistocephalus solidus TaxID=70667 RepID=A0A183SZ00_SCHSO|nr:unnamed protein product [Schistocephalus solidus]
MNVPDKEAFVDQYINPECTEQVKVHTKLISHLTSSSIRKYIFLNLRGIFTIRGNSIVVIRGPPFTTKRLASALMQLDKRASSIFCGLSSKKAKLPYLCTSLGFDYENFGSADAATKVAVYKFLKDCESLRPALAASTPKSLPESLRRPNANGLRPVIIDGANVAHENGGKKEFSAQNLRLALDYFLQLGQKEVTIVLHAHRQWALRGIFSDDELKKYFCFTSFRRLEGDRPMVADNDSVILELATRLNGVVVSNDHYRDWLSLRPEFSEVIRKR